jgi:tRNA A37 methylthiotransferase MiaB
VPLTRGPSRSRPKAEILAEARRLLRSGFREISLSGVNLAQYGRDLAEPHDFWDLTVFLERELAPEWAGRVRLRLSSLEPGQLGEKALDSLARSRLVAPHIHLSLQSGSPRVLRRMGRGHYSPSRLPEFFRSLAGIWPRFGLGADLLTAFPAETEQEFAETLDLCRVLPLSYAHVFPYSRRPGTPAAGWPEQIPSARKKERAAALRALAAEKKDAFLHASLALDQVLVVREGASARGVNEYYSDCLFTTVPKAAPRLELTAAKPVGLRDGALLVEPLGG